MSVSPAAIVVVLLALIALVALNLLLTLRLAAIVQQREYDRLPLAFPVGTPLPAFMAHRLVDGRACASASLAGAAAVLVFLSPACGDCKGKRDALARMHAAIAASGIHLWLFGAGSERGFLGFLDGTPLAPHAMRIRTSVRKRLNARGAAPFYLFVDDAGIVIASGFAGDADWQSFEAQMQEALASMAMPACARNVAGQHVETAAH